VAKQRGRTRAWRGPRGERGKRGAIGPPGIAPKELRAIISNLGQLRAEAAIQFQRIAQLQAQVDRTLKALQELGARAGYSRQPRKRRPATRR
jgi:hypothetical protein